MTGGHQAVWEINHNHVNSQQLRDLFADVGVIITGTLGASISGLIITQKGRQTFPSSISVRCTALNNNIPMVEFGDLFFIFTYGE